MITRITISSITKGKSGTNAKGTWTQVAVVDSSGTKYSAFDAKLLNLAVGAIIEIDYEKKDNFNNISQWHLIEEPSTEPARQPKPITAPLYSPSETRNRAFALSYAKDYGIPLKLTPDEIIEVARKFDAYLNGK